MEIILWDIDGTILDFEKAEKAAIRTCFSRFGLGQCTDGMIERYSGINRKYWERLERGEITKTQVLEGRFREFFQTEGISFDGGQAEERTIAAFNAEYQIRLGDTICFNDDAYELIKRLKGKVGQYAVTNGTRTAQERKLERSGLDRLLDGIFISEEVGIEKPHPGFFDYVFEQIGVYKKDKVMIVGDSLTSDMQGGNNAGILCCWYNPKKKKDPAAKGPRIDYEIQNLSQVETIVKEKKGGLPEKSKSG